VSSADGHVLWLEECGADAAPLVGGKAVGLGHLVRLGHRVPPGFAVTTAAYREALAAGGRPATVGDRLAAELVAAYRRLGRAVVPPGTSAVDRMLAYLGRPGAPGQAGPG
jgi:pyruvate,water dikinase